MDSPFRAWESFYVIVGSAAAGLTGLQFVVMALIADSTRPRTEREIDAFGTPTIVHFGAAMFVSATLSAPWPHVLGPALTSAGCGLFGLVYGLIVYRRTRHTTYQPVLEDWIWHVALPLVSYGTLLAAGALLPRHTLVPQFVVAGASLMLLFVGIHNAWDTVRFVVTDGPATTRTSTDGADSTVQRAALAQSLPKT